MEANFDEIAEEEFISGQIGEQEDQEEFNRHQQEKIRRKEKRMSKKR